MDYSRAYFVTGFIISLLLTYYIILRDIKGFSDVLNERAAGARKDILEQGFKKGHLQKEVYGERVVYYERDFEGEVHMASAHTAERLYLKYKFLIGLFYLLLVIAVTSFAWPYVLFVLYREGIKIKADIPGHKTN